jgi:hypothetical protein
MSFIIGGESPAVATISPPLFCWKQSDEEMNTSHV